jgi:hypothetical protein
MPEEQPGGPYEHAPTTFTVSPRYPHSTTVTTISTYETLPADAERLALLDPRRAHPAARELPVAQLSSDIAAYLARPLPAVAPPPPNVPRLVVDPLRGAVGSFVVGESVLALSKILPPPLVDFPVLPGNLHDARAVGVADAAGSVVVTFRDANEVHSSSASITRPFSTTRGDVNGADGTTLAQFLARWPEHGEPQRSGGGTKVAVGEATFAFDASDRLVSVSIAAG